MSNSHIPNGCIMLARKIQESEIWNKPADWLKIWIYILQEVNHRENKRFPRGTNFFNAKEMARDCGVSHHSIHKFIKWAKSATLVATQKTTRGIVLSVLQYDKYQTLQNYKSDTSGDTVGETEAIQGRYRSDTINKNVKNEKNEKKVLSDKPKDTNTKKHLIPYAMFCFLFDVKCSASEQWSALIRRNVRLSTKLSDVPIESLASALVLAEAHWLKNRDYPIRLETVDKFLEEYSRTGLTPQLEKRRNDLLVSFEKQKDSIFSPSKK